MLGRSCFSLWLMLLTSFACSAAAATSLRLDPEPAWRKAVDLAELTEIMDVWLDENSDFQRPGKKPIIR
ncbi:MAG: hypothetical protein HKO14_03535, partial [Silicimonas sp.]|nr:hypothetical protein [Silicimonas sp.]